MGIAKVHKAFEGFSKKDSSLDSDLILASKVIEITIKKDDFYKLITIKLNQLHLLLID